MYCHEQRTCMYAKSEQISSLDMLLQSKNVKETFDPAPDMMRYGPILLGVMSTWCAASNHRIFKSSNKQQRNHTVFFTWLTWVLVLVDRPTRWSGDFRPVRQATQIRSAGPNGQPRVGDFGLRVSEVWPWKYLNMHCHRQWTWMQNLYKIGSLDM